MNLELDPKNVQRRLYVRNTANMKIYNISTMKM